MKCMQPPKREALHAKAGIKLKEIALRNYLSFFFPVLISMGLNFKYFSSSDSSFAFVSFAAAILSSVAMFAAMAYYTIVLVRSRDFLDAEDFKNRYGFLYQEYKNTSLWSVLVHPLFLLKRTLLVLSLLLLTSSVPL